MKRNLDRKDAFNWAYALFVNHGELFLPMLERLEEQADKEVENLVRIFEDFQLQSNSRILDFSCGIGRHSIRLAERGFQVTGYDPSPLYHRKSKRKGF